MRSGVRRDLPPLFPSEGNQSRDGSATFRQLATPPAWAAAGEPARAGPPNRKQSGDKSPHSEKSQVPTPASTSPNSPPSLTPNLRTTIRNCLVFLTRFSFVDIPSFCVAASYKYRLTTPTFPSTQSHPGQSGDPWPPPCPPYSPMRQNEEVNHGAHGGHGDWEKRMNTGIDVKHSLLRELRVLRGYLHQVHAPCLLWLRLRRAGPSVVKTRNRSRSNQLTEG